MALSATNVNLRGSFGPARPLQYRHAAKNVKASLAKPHQEFISKRVVVARPGLTQFRTREPGIAKAAASDGDQPGASKKDVETSADDISKAGPEKEAVKAEKSTGEQEKKGRLVRLWDGIVDTATTSLYLLKESWSVLMKGFLAFFIIHELCALFQFFIQRLSHRMLNEGVACYTLLVLPPRRKAQTQRVFLSPMCISDSACVPVLLSSAAVQFLSLPDGAMQSLWYAIDRPEIMNFQTGDAELSHGRSYASRTTHCEARLAPKGSIKAYLLPGASDVSFLRLCPRLRLPAAQLLLLRARHSHQRSRPRNCSRCNHAPL